jgi:Tol biopolymer transport system component/predicted Ser/Thr protein kinase
MGERADKGLTELDPLAVTTPVSGPGADGASLERGAVISRYVIGEVLGAGGMGIVYRAFDPELARPVALKVLHPETSVTSTSSAGRSRLIREAQALAKLAHPNVIAVHDVGTTGEQVFLAMELVEGKSLGAWMRERRSPWREVLRVLDQAGRGLDAAHRAGLVHRDFKPENVLIGGDGRVRVVDFGLARPPETTADSLAETGPAREDPLAVSITRTGAILGTPLYMAPEQHAGRTADARTDQFAFCLVLHEALVGVHPFHAETREELARNAGGGLPDAPPRGVDLPRHVWRALQRGLRPAPADRFPSMHELLAALEPAQGARRGTLVLAALAVTGIAIAVGLMSAVNRRETAAPLVQPPKPTPWGALESRRQITFTGGATLAELSPDGRRVAYVSSTDVADKLVVQDLSSGASHTVLREAKISAVRWSPDGTRLSLGTTRGLMAIPADGGDEIVLGACNTHAWSPDGARLVSACQDLTVSVIDLATRERRAVPVPMTDAWIIGVDWSREDDRLLLMTAEREGVAFWSMRLDGSEPRRIHEDRDHVGGDAPRWARTFDGFTYLGSLKGSAEVVAVAIAGSETKVSTLLEHPQLASFSWSDGEKALAYTLQSTHQNLVLWTPATGPTATPTRTPLTFGTHPKGAMALSPDGRTVAVAIARGVGLGAHSLFVLPATGGTPREVAQMHGQILDLAWSPGGDAIAMSVLQDEAKDVWIADVATGETKALHLPGVAMVLAWTPSPDLIYQQEGNRTYTVVDLTTGRPRKLLEEGAQFVFAAEVSPDGKKLVMQTFGPKGRSGLRLVDLAGPSDGDLIEGEFVPVGWAADGRWIYALVGSGIAPATAMVAISVDGKQVRRMMTVPPGVDLAGALVASDGKSALVMETTETSDVWLAGDVGTNVAAALPAPGGQFDGLPLGHTAPPSPAPNLDFEQGKVGEAPAGWHASVSTGPEGAVVAVDDREGTRALRLDAGRKDRGNAMQYFPSVGYEGKRVRLRAKLRTDGPEVKAYLWLRTETGIGEEMKLSSSREDPVATTEWTVREVIVDVGFDAELISLGVQVNGKGSAWLDDVSLQVVP